MASNVKETKKNIFVRAWEKFSSFFRNIFLELKKCSWPTKKKVAINTLSVLIFCLIVGLIIWGADSGLNALMKLIRNL